MKRLLSALAAVLLTLALFPLAQAVESTPTYPRMDASAVKPTAAPQWLYKAGFPDVLTATWSGEWQRLRLGTGMANSQASGTGIITSGTTANSETILRLRQSFAGAFSLRAKVTLSQRIVNNNFFIELVDLIGDDLACTINGTTSITVQLPAGYPSMSAVDVGKSVTVGNVTGAAGVPSRAAIASVDTTGRLVTLTVAGWPASGSCTVSLWGLNSYRMLYDSTTATNMKFDTYRNGWGSGDTTLTINTTASPHVFNLVAEDVSASILDTTANSITWTQRGQRTELLPDNNVNMVLQVRALNGTTNPASTTTFTIGNITLERFDTQAVSIVSQKAAGGLNGAPTVNIGTNGASNASTNVAQINGVTPLMGNGVTGTGSLRVTLASDFTTNTNPLLVGGTGATSIGKAEDAVAGTGDTGIFQLGVRRDALTQSASAAGDYAEVAVDRFGAMLVRTYEKSAKTYRAASNVTLAASATDVWDLPGNGTTTVLVTKIRVTGVQTTLGAPEMLIVKRSTANTAGTRVAQTAVPLDAGDAAASSTPGAYTANPTTGSLIGALSRAYVVIPTAAAPVAGSGWEWNFGDKGKAILLSGTAQVLALNLNGVTVTGGVLNIECEWIEY